MSTAEGGAQYDGPSTLAPVSLREREPVLDVLRGFAVLGILLVNIEFMRGPDAYLLFAGAADSADGSLADATASFLVGWLATGKFVSSFSIMFGIGAALMSRRAFQSGHTPRPLLARRYAWLMVLGLAHMLLLFPGDILFAYGLTGMLLLVFVRWSPRDMLHWGYALLIATTLALVMLVLPPAIDSDDGRAGTSAETTSTAATVMAEYERETSVEIFRDGSYADIVMRHASQAWWLQTGQLIILPWTLALFLIGFAIARSGVIDDLRRHQGPLQRAATLGLVIGIPANLVLGVFGPFGGLGGDPHSSSPLLLALGVAAQFIAAPLLAVGYLCTLALWGLRRGTIRPLAVIGRMALSAYLLQSALALIVFAGFDLYDRLTPASGLLVVVAIWAVVLAFCALWSTWFRFGPAEWLWRSLTYGRVQPIRL
jgi:uncharacterized protein